MAFSGSLIADEGCCSTTVAFSNTGGVPVLEDVIPALAGSVGDSDGDTSCFFFCGLFTLCVCCNVTVTAC